MKIPFSDITVGGIRRIVSDTGWSAPSGQTFADPPTAEITLLSINEGTVSLQGTMLAAVESQCSRCGVSVPFTVNETFTYIFRLGEDSALLQKEVECGSEDCETVFVEEPVIDLDEILAEQLILATPAKLLCSEKCRGLCPQCGTSLNNGQCSCGEEHSNSPFAVLKHLTK